MISDFKIFPIMLLRQLNFGVLSVQQLLYVCYKEKIPFSFNLWFLLLLSEGGLSPESCLAICHPVAYKKTKCSYINIPAGIYLLKVNNRNTRTRCEICSKLTINTPERRQWRRSGVFIVNFEHISHLVLVFLLLTLNK